MTQQEHEEYVRSKWKHIEVHRELIAQGVNAGFKWWILIVRVGRMNSCITEAAAWQAAYDFTVAREEEIRQLKAEIMQIECDIIRGIPWMLAADKEHKEWTSSGIEPAWNDAGPCYQRTLSRLQRDLAELTKGMVQP